MDTNPYEAPSARIDAAAPGDDALFYVVSPRKFLLLMIGTAGLYKLYWFYRNWALLNRRDKSYWPVMRAIFSIFFTHSLLAEVQATLAKRQVPHRWSDWWLATGIVVLSIVINVFDRLAVYDIGSVYVDVLGLALLFPLTWLLFMAQKAINAAELDPAGTRNERLTVANILWLALGFALWALGLLGLYATYAGVPLE